MQHQNRLLQSAKEILLPKIKEKILIERAKIQSFLLQMANKGFTSDKYPESIHDINKKYLEAQGIKVEHTHGRAPAWTIWEPGYYLTITISEQELQDAILK